MSDNMFLVEVNLESLQRIWLIFIFKREALIICNL